ncbi:MAG: DUF3500 domain-containing protein [Chloroflexota bacterium]
MMKRLSRRQFLNLSTTSVGLAMLGISGCASSNQSLPPELDLAARQESASSDLGEGTGSERAEITASTVSEQSQISDMAQAATEFLQSLQDSQRNKAVYAFDNEERFRWHWTSPGRFARNGLPLREMQDEQRQHAVALLEASLSGMGFEKALNIISLQVDLGNDPELYFVTIFGTPGSDEPWGWRWEGHHLSHHFSVIDDQLVMTPFFLGAWPTTTEAGLRAMAIEEDAALELINTLPTDLRDVAIFQERPITSHVTQNAAQVSALEPVGITYADLDATQQQLVSDIIQAYLGTQPDYLAADHLARITNAGMDNIQFGWAGSLERQRPQYYRLQGPTFLLEYDNTRGGGTHIHSVWRDFERDFGYHLL